jgi:hypothetical protein
VSYLLLAQKYWKLIGLGLLLMALGIQTARLSHAKGNLEQAKINLNECREGRKQDRAAYEQAQRDAAAKNEAEVKRIETEQEQINAEAKSRYERDLARLRAGGLRKDLAAPPRDPRGPKAGSDGAPACRDDEQNLCVSRARVMQAGEIELKANSLIDWINEQLGVNR